MKLVGFTTVYVFVFAALNQTNVDLRIIMSMHFFGVFLIPYMTYCVLTDKYKTNKSFKDWYEDHTMDTLEDDDEK